MIDWQRTRFWIYTTLAAAQPLILWYGIASEATVALWATAITTMLGATMAGRYSSSKVAVTTVE
jgi:hypothetical protein